MLDRAFGKYELIRRLGRGGMADVYLARDTECDRQVALKLVEIRQDRESRDIYDAERRGAMLQEQFCRLDTHVPFVNGYATWADHFYLDMEYVEGEDLAERIGRGPLAPDHAAAVATEVCAFLERAHAFEATVEGLGIHGIIHGDIKPKNVRLDLEGHVKILDFGIAKGLSLTRRLTRNDFGSLAYLSPERLDTGDVDVQSDLWAVGVLLYEMLASVPPFEHQDAQRLEQIIRSRQAPPPLGDDCPAALARIVFKMLAANLARRYPNASAMRADLEAYRAGQPTEADRLWLSDSADTDATRRTRPPDDADAPPDADATRRTSSSEPEAAADRAGESEATRRTTPVVQDGTGTGPAASTAPPVIAPPVRRRSVVGRMWRAKGWRRGAFAAAACVLVALMWNEARVWSAARDLRVDLATRQGSAINEIWDQYETLSRRSVLGFGLAAVRGPLKERLVTRADQVIADYRQDAPSVREAQWRDAAAWLTNALTIDPGDRTAAASLQYCEGQLQRITGEARKRKKLPATDNLHEAVNHFQESARLNSRWPDPYLGLARTYIYGLDDVDKAVAALDEAERRGYRPGNRELVQMADGYRRRGDRMQAQAAEVRGLDQEQECLQKAADDYRRALDLYGKAIGFGETTTSIKQVQKQLETVTARQDEISSASTLKSIENGLKGILKGVLGPKEPGK
ncbi:MAG: protein kinase domain-containing protein [Bacteroidales bacterium]